MKIIVGTNNQKKLDVVQSAFTNVYSITVELEGYNAKSGVPEAPHDKETYDGARNRAEECQKMGQADFYVGIESGLVERYGNYFEEAWAVVISKDGIVQIGYSSGLLLPPIVVDRMKKGEKHNDIMFSIDTQLNLPDDNRDTWSRYTGGGISRQVSLEEALRNALIQSVGSENNLYSHK